MSKMCNETILMCDFVVMLSYKLCREARDFQFSSVKHTFKTEKKTHKKNLPTDGLEPATLVP